MSVDEGAVKVGPLLYQSSLVFSSLNGIRDDGNYTCSVTVSPFDISNLLPVTTTATHVVSVESKLIDTESLIHHNVFLTNQSFTYPVEVDWNNKL